MTTEEKRKALLAICSGVSCRSCDIYPSCKNVGGGLTPKRMSDAQIEILWYGVFGKQTTEPTREQKIAELCTVNAYHESFFEGMPDSRVNAYYDFHKKVKNFKGVVPQALTMEFEPKVECICKREQQYDNVNSPQHYSNYSIECIDAMVETQGQIATVDFCVCNAFKYLWRHNAKNGVEDIRKASWYLNKAVELMDGEKGD